MDEPRMHRRSIPGVTDVDDKPRRRNPNDPPQEPGKRGVKPNSRTGVFTERQKIFIREFMVDQNATAAARRAGYSEASAKIAHTHLMKNPAVVAEINRLMADRLKQTELSADGVLAKMKAMTSGDVRDIFDEDGKLLHPRRLPDDIATRIAGIKVVTKTKPSDDPDGAVEVEYISEIKLWGMDVQLTNLAKAFAMFSDKPAGAVTIVIQGGLPDDDFSNEPIPDIVLDDTQEGLE